MKDGKGTSTLPLWFERILESIFKPEWIRHENGCPWMYTNVKTGVTHWPDSGEGDQEG